VSDDREPLGAEFSRDLSLFHITMMGMGMMIGAGVFIGIGNSIREAGPGGAVLTFALNAVIALFTAMSFAELSSAVPRAGGAYNFARIAFGRGTSFLAGWMEWFASSVAGSLYALIFASYVVRYVAEIIGWQPAEEPLQIAVKLTAVATACFFLYINYRGASETGRIGAFFTLGQTLFLALIGVVGVIAVLIDPARFQNFGPFLPNGWGRLLMTMGFIYVAFEGFEVIAQAGDEAIEPKRNIPKAMIYSVFVAGLTYVAVTFATVVAVKPGTVDGPVWRWLGSFGDEGFREGVKRLMPMGGLLVTLAVIFSSTSALNATIYSAARASYALGRDRMLPAVLAKISTRRRTPHVAIALTGLLLISVAMLPRAVDVASCTSMMFLLLFLLVNLCVIKIRRNMGDELTYGFLMPLFPLLPLIAILCQVTLAVFIVHMSLIAWVIAPLWVLAGLGIYLLYSRSHALTTAEEIHVLEEGPVLHPAAAPSGAGGYSIMVAVANPENALSLVRNTYRICQAKNARVELLHMVPAPPQVPLSDAGKYMLAGKEGLLETMLYLAPLFPITTTLRYCRNAARGIVSAVREKHIDMLILGWHGRPKAHTFWLGSTIDPVIERVPCHTAIFKDCGGDRVFKRVLVPLAGGPNGALALEIASILAEKDQGQIVAFTVRRGKQSLDLEAFVSQTEQRLYLPPQRVQTKSIRADDVVEAIINEAEDYDLVVLGTTRQPLLSRVTGHPIPETVARRCQKPLVMVKAAAGIRSWIKRWL